MDVYQIFTRISYRRAYGVGTVESVGRNWTLHSDIFTIYRESGYGCSENLMLADDSFVQLLVCGMR
jgi:hypothetical protein